MVRQDRKPLATARSFHAVHLSLAASARRAIIRHRSHGPDRVSYLRLHREWLGTARGDRLGRMPLTRLPA